MLDDTVSDYEKLSSEMPADERKRLRDRFAGLAMHAIIMRGTVPDKWLVVRSAYDYADLMLDAMVGDPDPEWHRV